MVSLEVIYPSSSYIFLWNNDLVLKINFRIGSALIKGIVKAEHFGSS